MGAYFRECLGQLAERYQAPCQVNGVGSLSCLYFSGEPVTDYQSAKQSDVKEFGEYFRYLLDHGIYVAPSQFEAIFLSSAHTKEDIDRTLSVMEAYFDSRYSK